MASPKFFDSHCHLDFPDFNIDRDKVWHSCNLLGVTSAIIPGVSPLQWQQAATLCNKYTGLYYSVGLHPWETKEESDFNSLRPQIILAAKASKCVAIGECGLDATIETSMAKQQTIFDIHLQLANELSLPVIIHCRKTHNEIIVSLKQHKLKRGGVIHAFSGSIDLAQQYWELGFYLGIGGTITYERANKTRATVRQLPLEAILLETDAPDMPLNGKQGQRNSPEYIPHIAQTLAQLRGESLEKIAMQTSENAHTLFRIK